MTVVHARPGRTRGIRRPAVILVVTALVAGLLLTTGGCTRWKQMKRDQKGPDAKISSSENVSSEPYLASVVAYRAGLLEQAVVVVAFNLNSFSVGKQEFVVVNKWGRLPSGKYVDRIKILAPDRKTEVGNDQTEFESPGELRNTTVLSRFEIDFKEAGAYWVQVFLGDRLIVEYPFQVTPKGDGSE